MGGMGRRTFGRRPSAKRTSFRVQGRVENTRSPFGFVLGQALGLLGSTFSLRFVATFLRSAQPRTVDCLQTGERQAFPLVSHKLSYIPQPRQPAISASRDIFSARCVYPAVALTG